MPTQSIKQRILGAKVSNMAKVEFAKLFNAVLSDMTVIRGDVSNLQVTANALVTDIIKVNCNTGSANNTVAITATPATVSASTGRQLVA